MAHRTIFAGLAAPDAGDGTQVLGADFIYRNPDLTDQFLRIGAKTHRHDGTSGLPSPLTGVTLAAAAAGGSLAAQTYYATYTVVDSHGGETEGAPVESISLISGVTPPVVGPSATVGSASGILPDGNYAYALTYTDGAGGETTLGPTTWVYVNPGFASANITLFGLATTIAPAGTAVNWRLWRSYEGEDWHLVFQGSADTYVDNGFDPPDNPARPPDRNTSGGTSVITLTLPGAAEVAFASATTINVYLSLDPSMPAPCLYQTLPVACASATITIADDIVVNGSPPSRNLSIGGAPRILGPLEVIGWQTLIASASGIASGGSALPGSAHAQGELVFQGAGGVAVTLQDLGGGSALITITDTDTGGGGGSLTSFEASAGDASGSITGVLGFAASGGASVELVNVGGGSGIVLISASGLQGPQGIQGATGAVGGTGMTGLQGPPGPAGSGSAASLEVAYVQTGSANVVVGTSNTDILTLPQIPAGTKGPVWLDFQVPAFQIQNTTSYGRFEIVDDLGNIVMAKITPVNNVTASWFGGSFNMRAKVENPGGRTYKVRASANQGGGTVTLEPWTDTNGTVQPIYFAAVGTYVPFSGAGTNHSVGGSGAVGLVSPDTYIEFGGSGGVSIAVQNMGGGSARVVISAQAGASGVAAGSGYAYPRQLAVFGHSYGTSVFGGTSGIGLANRQSTRLAQALGAIESNFAVSGSVLGVENQSGLTGAAATGGLPTVYSSFMPASGSAPYLSPLGTVLLCTGINDYCMFGSAGFPTYFPAVLQAATDRLRCGRTFEDGDASVTYPSGGWTNSAFDGHVNSGTSLHGTSASAGTVQVALPADYNGEAVVFGTVLNGGSPAPWSTTATCTLVATVGGVQVGSTLDLKALWNAFNNATTHTHNGFATLRIPKGVLPAGAQNVLLTFTNPGLNSIWFDWWGIEADTPPIILLEEPLRLTSTGYTAESGSRPFALDDTGVGLVLAALKQVASVYTDARVIVATGHDAAINKNAALLSSDQVHPNAAGAGIVAGYEFAALAQYLSQHPVEALQTQKDDIGPNLGALTVARAYCAALVPGGFVNGWNKIPLDTVSFDPGQNFQVTGGSHKYVCPTAGYYSVKAQLLLANQAADVNYIAIYQNGNQTADGAMKTASGAVNTLNSLAVDDILKCSAGDTIELYLNTTNTTAAYLAGGDSPNNYLSVVRVA